MALLCKDVFQSNMLLSCSCWLLFWQCVITFFDFNEVNIPARRVYSLYVSLMAILRSNWQYANSIWSRAGSKFIC